MNMQKDEIESWLSHREEQLRHGLAPIAHDLQAMVNRHGFGFLLIDGPQGMGKTRYLEPVFQEMMEQSLGFTPEAICTNYSMISRSERGALSAEQYKDLWNWYRFPKLVQLVSDAIDAHTNSLQSITIVDWYNRAKGGISDSEPLIVGIKPIVIIEGIGALSDDIIGLLQQKQISFVSIMFNAPEELRFSGILSARSYRAKDDQLTLMKTVDASYFTHYPRLLENANYYAYLTKTDFTVSSCNPPKK